MKKIIIIIAIAAAVIVGLSIFKDIFIKGSVETVARAATGLELKIQSLKTSLIGQSIEIKGMRVLNPKGFEEKELVNIPEIFVRFDLPAILKGNLHFPQIRLDLGELKIVKNKGGALNIDSLKSLQESKKSASAKESTPKIQIDVLELKIGKVSYLDYTGGGSPKVTSVDLRLNERFTNVTDFGAITSLIVMKALMNTTIGRLADVDLGGLQSSLVGSMGSVQGLALQSGGVATKLLGGAAGGTSEELQKAGEKLGSVLKGLPFGSSENKK